MNYVIRQKGEKSSQFNGGETIMGIKNDEWIRKTATENGMIEPFEPHLVKKGVSFGVSSYGYDFRISDRFQVFNPAASGASPVMDPKSFDPACLTEFVGDVCEIPPHGYVLAQTIEYFRIPRDVLTICFGKSTYARVGVFVNVTPFEPEWEGYATIAISNSTPFPARVYANEGIGQLIFLEANEVCHTSYADRKGKYQTQKEITHAKI